MRKELLGICLLGALQEALWVLSTRLGPLRQRTGIFIVLMLAAFALCFLGFLRLQVRASSHVFLVLGFAFLFRLTVLPAEPHQSEDVYRYLWDARVASSGSNPFAHPPDSPALAPLRDSQIYPKINSKPYVTAYPPLSQVLFRLSYSVFGAEAVPMKALFGGLEFCALLVAWRLLVAFGQPLRRLLLWAWNPFFIFEFSYSGHSDSGMLLGAVASLYFLHRGSTLQAALSYSAAVLSKLHPALWLPVYLRRLGWKGGLAIAAPVLALSAVYFTPETLWRYVNSLRLYFQLFEFNASIHYVWRFIGRVFYHEAWNKSNGPYLGAATLLIAAVVAWRFPARDARDVAHAAFWIMTADLCLATTVHPWYIAWAAFALPFLPYAFMFYWTGACFLSYAAYSHKPVYEPSWALLLEYVPVYALMAWEIHRRGPQLEEWVERRQS